MLYVNPLSHDATSTTWYRGRADAAGSLTPEQKAAKETKALNELERFFAYTLIKEMKKTVEKSDFLSGGAAEDHYDDMLNDVFAGAIADSGQFGIAQQIREQLAMRGEVATTNVPPLSPLPEVK